MLPMIVHKGTTTILGLNSYFFQIHFTITLCDIIVIGGIHVLRVTSMHHVAENCVYKRTHVEHCMLFLLGEASGAFQNYLVMSRLRI